MSSAPFSFSVAAAEDGEQRRFAVAASTGERREYVLPGNEQRHYSEFFAALSRDFGTRPPHVFAKAIEHPLPRCSVMMFVSSRRLPVIWR